MANNIKGITVEIGGDTTKLGKALQDVEKKSRDLSSELGSINKLLKLDPGNADLLAQKQEVLSSAIQNTSAKLKKLKEAEKDVQAQFEKGEVSEEQVRALQREIIATTKKLDSYEKASEETAEAIDKLGKKSDDAEDEVKDLGKSANDLGSKLGGAVKGGLSAITKAVGGLATAMGASAESTREYRTNMGKLETAFNTAGHSTKEATKTYQALQGILGESDQAVEASNHLAKLCDNEKDLEKWTKIATGVYAEFGASLPIENLTEASNETAKTGALTGGLADALNWAGVNEEQFQAKLDKCSNEQERQALITETLSGLYNDSAEAYRKNNEEVIRANQANEALTSSLADIGASVEPLMTDIKMLGASLLSDLIPGVKQVTEAFRGVLNGDEGATAQLGTALSNIITSLLTKITELLPTVATIGVNLITTLATTIITSLPQLLTTGVQIIMAILNGLTTAIPQITSAIVGIMPKLVTALVTGIPQLIQGAITLFLAIVQAIPQILPPLLLALPDIVLAICNGLISAIPQLIDGALQFLLAIIDAIPLLIEQLIPQIPEIVETVIMELLDCIPQLVEASFDLLMAIVKAIPMIVKELIKAVPKIIDTINSIMAKLPGKLWTILKTAITKFAEFGMTVRQTAKSAFDKLVSVVISIAKGLPGKIKTAIWTAITIVGTWGANMLSKAKDAVGKVVSGITTKFKEVVGKVKTIGGDIAKGVWNGISDKVSWIKSKIVGFKDQVLNSLKDAFGIKSPSRVMKKEVGENIALGVIEGIKSKKANAKKSAKELSEIYVESAKSKLDTFKKLNKLTEADEVAFWTKIKSACKKGSSAYVEASIELTKAKTTLNDDIKALDKKYSDDVKNIKDQLKKDIQEVTNAYDKAIESRTNQIKSSLGLFDLFAGSDAIAKEDLITNLNSQVDALREWDSVLDQLSNRKGMDSGLLTELEGMGVKSLATLQQINSMTDEELTQYIALFNQKNAIALERAETENKALKEQSQADIQELISEANNSLNELEKTYKSNLKALGVTTADTSKNIGKDIIKSLKSGIESEYASFQKYLNDLFSSINASVNNAMRVDTSKLNKLTVESVNVGTIDRQLNTTSNNDAGVGSNAVLDKLESIANKLDNKTQIVLDTGVLVGETINKIDSALATNQSLNLRGV